MSSRRFIKWLVLLAVVYAGYCLLKPLPPPTIHPLVSLPASHPAQLQWPKAKQSSVAAAGYGLLSSQGDNKAVPMASTAKIVAALAILQQKPLKVGESGPLITIGSSDVGLYKYYLSRGGSVLPVNLGEQISEYQALQAMLLPSANNIAQTAANWAFGSAQKYNQYAATYLQALGLSHTTIADASGFSPASKSSAQDLVTLGLEAKKSPVISQIASQKTAKLPLVGRVNNVNWLLGTDGIDGLKTGNTDQAGGCYLLSSAVMVGSQKIHLVVAVMGAPDLKTALTGGLKLANSAAANFKSVSAVKTRQLVAGYRTTWGQQTNLVSTSTLSEAVWPTNIGVVEVKAGTTLTAANQSAGQISWSVNGHTLTSDLRTQTSLPPPSIWWRLTHPRP